MPIQRLRSSIRVTDNITKSITITGQTGAASTSTDGTRNYFVFTSTGSVNVKSGSSYNPTKNSNTGFSRVIRSDVSTNSTYVDYLVVAGGGGGGSSPGTQLGQGGGGAGGGIRASFPGIPATFRAPAISFNETIPNAINGALQNPQIQGVPVTVTVGSGGGANTKGNPSSAFGFSATGGGRGGVGGGNNGQNGGNGGGSGPFFNTGTSGGSGNEGGFNPPEGFSGNSYASNPGFGQGGGGGGLAASPTNSSTGTAAISLTIAGTPYSFGAGGGGGGRGAGPGPPHGSRQWNPNGSAPGGPGGGGPGNAGSASNYGSGGGGGGESNSGGGTGSNGLVIISVPV